MDPGPDAPSLVHSLPKSNCVPLRRPKSSIAMRDARAVRAGATGSRDRLVVSAETPKAWVREPSARAHTPLPSRVCAERPLGAVAKGSQGCSRSGTRAAH